MSTTSTITTQKSIIKGIRIRKAPDPNAVTTDDKFEKIIPFSADAEAIFLRDPYSNVEYSLLDKLKWFQSEKVRIEGETTAKFQAIQPTTETIFVPTSITAVTTATDQIGTVQQYARADHIHTINVSSGSQPGWINIAGSSIQVQGWTPFTSAVNGLVPAPSTIEAKDLPSKFLAATGGWVTPTDTTYQNVISTLTSGGTIPKPSTTEKTANYVLTGVGWREGTKYNTDTDTTYSLTNKNVTLSFGSSATLANFKSGTATTNLTVTMPANPVTKAAVTAALGFTPVSSIPEIATFTSAKNGLVPAAKSKDGKTSYSNTSYILTGAGWKYATKYNSDTVTTDSTYTVTNNNKTLEWNTTATLANFSGSGGKNVNITVKLPDNPTSPTKLFNLGFVNTTFTNASNGLVPAAKNGTTNYATSSYVLTGAGWKAFSTSVTNSNSTLAWNTKSSIGTVNGVSLTVTLPQTPVRGGTATATTQNCPSGCIYCKY